MLGCRSGLRKEVSTRTAISYAQSYHFRVNSTWMYRVGGDAFIKVLLVHILH